MAASTLAGFGESAIASLKEAARSENYRRSKGAIQALARINHPGTESALMELDRMAGVSQRSNLASESAKFAVRFGASTDFINHAKDNALRVVDEIRALDTTAQREQREDMRLEIEARSSLGKRRLLDWFAVATEPARVFDVIPLIMPLRADAVSPSDRAMALELLETLTRDRALRQGLKVFDAAPSPDSEVPAELNDEWLDWLQEQQSNSNRGEIVDLTQMVILLRKCPLFHDLKGEALRAIAEVSELREITRGERIFSEGDYPDGLYVVVHGFVNSMKGEEVMAVHKSADVLGEFELLDDSPRMAHAVAAADGMLLYINKEAFERIAEDIPPVLRSLALRVIVYLRNSLMHRPDAPDRSRTTYKRPEESITAQAAGDSTREPLIDDAPLSSKTPEFMKVEPGASVLLSAGDGEEVEILLRNHPFKLHVSSEPFIVDQLGEEFSLVVGENMIGRDERCDIVVNSKMGDVSRQHAVLDYTAEGEIRLTNLSTAGTRVPSRNVS